MLKWRNFIDREKKCLIIKSAIFGIAVGINFTIFYHIQKYSYHRVYSKGIYIIIFAISYYLFNNERENNGKHLYVRAIFPFVIFWLIWLISRPKLTFLQAEEMLLLKLGPNYTYVSDMKELYEPNVDRKLGAYRLYYIRLQSEGIYVDYAINPYEYDEIIFLESVPIGEEMVQW